MSRSGEFCPRCGDPIERDPKVSLPGGQRDPDRVLCDACYFEEFDLVDAPERVEVTVCSQCGAVHRGNRWVDVGAEDYTDVAVEAVSEELGVHVDAESVSWQVAPEEVDETTIRMHCQFSGVIRETPVTEEVVVPVKIGRETCDRCGKIAGGSFASVVQIRADERTPTGEEIKRAREIAESYVAAREETGDRNAFITEVSEVEEGLNMKISTNQLGEGVAKQIVEELGGTYSDSERLISEDSDGNELYRVTYAVRLPRYRPGEIIDPDDGDGPVLVTSVRGNLKGTRLASGDRYEAAFEDEDAPDARRLGEREDGTETTLVAIEDEHAVQVLDPETYETKSVPRPEFLDSDADEVPVLKSRAGLHLLPERSDANGGRDD
ncbi:NMD protein affecting ribosome stability and mRNA decay [Halapricum desulfuricans]|uniref:NMD protein affecting ribosome stability and mRNA decay n=1 Tax=Halapricum desulfuricans TaxID=2841257 RepID=A0A897NMI8_9EURY|nr:60S ribosomal export protein NMD3 [Halapricum desulfuricans]QSG12079.1 NMD protein affecting ribosome stability and mRNA decay [Halapricum desulfuricans]